MNIDASIEKWKHKDDKVYHQLTVDDGPSVVSE